MNIKNFLIDKFNLFLIVSILLFISVPFLEAKEFQFTIAPIIYFVVLFLSLRMLSLRRKVFFHSVLFLSLAVCADYILMVTTSSVLEGFLVVFSHMAYGGLIILSLAILIKKTFLEEGEFANAIKAGFSGYLLIGFLWMIFYSFVYMLDKKAFSQVMLDQVPFFYMSYSLLTGLSLGSVAPASYLALNLAQLEIIFGKLFLAVFVAKITGLYIVHQIRK